MVRRNSAFPFCLCHFALKILAAALAALLAAMIHSGWGHAAEPEVETLVQHLQEEWAVIFYQLPEDRHAAKFGDLLARAHALSERYPQRAEPLIVEGIVLCTYAGADIGFGILGKLERAKALFEKSIAIDPKALEGSAYVALGNLYHRLPGWPFSFGKDALARQYFETAQKLFPDAIDTNYFYGDFLLSQGEYEPARRYLEKAKAAPIRPDSQLSDLKLKEEVNQALADASAENDARTDFFSRFIPSFGDGEPEP